MNAVGRSWLIGTLLAAPACASTQLAWYGHTPDRTQRIEILQRGGEQWLSVGGRASRRCRAIATHDLAFTSDGSRLAFACEASEQRWTIVADFVDGKTWDGVAGLQFGPGVGRLVYAALDGARWRLVVDGVGGQAFDAIDVASIDFSPDGRRVGYIATEHGCARAVLDAEPRECVARVVGIALGDEARRDVVIVADEAHGEGAHVLVGSQRVLDLPRVTALAVDPAVEHWAVVAESPAGLRVVVDGREGEPFDRIDGLVWAPDGHAVAYIGYRSGSSAVIVGDRASAPHVEVERPAFSSNGAHVGYVARDAAESVVVVDDRVVWRSPVAATAIAFSDDGARYGWFYRDGSDTVIAVDGERYRFEVAVERTLRFSRDGRHWAALVGSRADRRLFLVVDGREHLPFDSEELFGDPWGAPDARLGAWVSAELELHLARAGGQGS